MIKTRLSGGLGNQIFQLAATLLLAKKMNLDKIILDDTHLASYNVKRENELVHFFNLEEIKFEKSFILKFRLPIKFAFKIKYCPFIGDKNFQNINNSSKLNIFLLDGYFQESLTQEDFDEEIKLLKLILKEKESDIKQGCVIHIRGGDFIKLGWNCVTPKEYYIEAIKKMKIDFNQHIFYIVTDDRGYSKTLLDDLDIEYNFIGSSMYEDFNLIGRFSYRILSSSTFCLWASALGRNENSKVIAPNCWIPKHERNIFLPNEIRIKI